MKLSQLLFLPTKNPPSDADTINHKLLVQGGFVRQLMAGVYTYTNLGLRVLNKISQIVREEMDTLGSLQIHMPALQPKANWVQTGGWDDIDVLFKLKSRTHRDYALGQSHEEIITPLVKELIRSEKDLPISLYQIQWKFRDELRAKSGILRGREFLMKDMYSFHANQDDFLTYYEKVKEAYLKIFYRLGLDAKVTEASGGNFSKKISYEFMVLTNAGEDDILYCQSCNYAINTEITSMKVGNKCPKCGASLEFGKACEAANVFDLGDRFSKAFDVSFQTSNNTKHYPVMGCYGIGISRNMGIIVEKHADTKGIIWPASVAPFQVEIIPLPGKEEAGEQLYKELQEKNIEVLIDDRSNVSAGAKFACGDLIGCPLRVVLSEKNGDLLELKARNSDEVTLLDKTGFLNSL